MVGTTISHYRVLEKIGQGGMGEVFLAHDTSLDRKVTLKFLPEFLQEDPTAKKRFLREAKSAAALDHPYICHIHEVGESDGKDFIAMEYVEGQSLKDKLAKGPLPLKQALETAGQIAAAVEKAHGKGIVHRDLKPSNVMLTPEGHVKVMDFGLAKRLLPEGVESQEQTITADLTKTGTTLGTLAYMSPEQLRGQEVDTRSDIFSFGVVLYEMLTGVHPFKKAQPLETTTAILSEVSPPLSRYMNQVSPVLQRNVTKLLVREPDRRYQLIHDVRIDLADLVDEIADPRPAEEVGTGPSQVGAPAAKRSWQERMRSGLMALLVIMLTVALWSLWRIAPTTEQPVSRFAIPLPDGQTFLDREIYMEISPDGKQLAYVATTSDSQSRQLYLRPMDDLESRPIANVEQPSHPVFSPDGKWIAVLDGDDQLVQKVSLSGGTLQTLCNLSKVAKGQGYFGHGWTPDGDALIFGNTAGLWRVSARGGTPEALTQVKEGEFCHAWPQILPGGKAVLFTRVRSFTPNGEQPNSIAVLSLETGERRILIEHGTRSLYLSSGHLVYSWDAKLLAAPFDLDKLQLTEQPVVILEDIATYEFGRAKFSVSENGSLAYIPGGFLYGEMVSPRTLIWVDREGAQTPLRAEPRPYGSLRISPDGSRLAIVVIGGGQVDVWIYDLVRETPTRLTFDPAVDTLPIWTPDGRRVVFASRRDGGQFNLFWRAADGTGEVERLTTSPDAQFPESFSLDGKQLVFSQWNPETGGDIHSLSMGDEPASMPLLQTPFGEVDSVVSPDGRSMAYVSDESGRDEVYVRPFPNVEEGKWPISSGGGGSPLWGPQGRELFYSSLDGETMMRVSIQSDPGFKAGTPETLFTRSDWIRANYDISPDGQRFLMLEPAEQTEQQPTPSQIIVVENWFEELKRLVPTN